jgi:hypothetical protein
MSVSDPSALWPLRDWLGRISGVTVAPVAGRPGPGELGAGDVLHVVAAAGGGGLLLAALRTLPEFIRSRRSNVKITVTTRERQLVLDAANVEDVLPVLDRMLDAQRADS